LQPKSGPVEAAGRRHDGVSREQPRVNSMLPQRWDEIKDKLGAILELEPARRCAYLDEIARSDPEMHQELGSLIASHDKAGTDFLELPSCQISWRPTCVIR
jgi:hypothetical protein